MKSSLEYFIEAIWKYIPEGDRIRVTHKFERFRERARIPSPMPETFVLGASERIFKRYPNAMTLEKKGADYALVCTAMNEINGLEDFIHSVGQQTLLPREVLICDGGSKDGTFQRLEKWAVEEDRFKVKVVREEGASIARGRNHAAALSTENYLLFTDLGTQLEENWAAYICSSFFFKDSVEFVMGFYEPRFTTWWHDPLAYFLLPRWGTIDPQTFFASARSLGVTKALFNEVGGFPETLSHAAEDSLFNFKIKEKAKTVVFVPEALSYWRMEADPIKMWKSIFKYAKGDAETGFLFWSYYRELLFKFSRLVFDLGVFIFLFFLAWFLSLGFLSDILRMFSYIFLSFGTYRVFKMALEYGVFHQGEIKVKVQRFLVLWYFLTAQVFGFLRGLRGSSIQDMLEASE